MDMNQPVFKKALEDALRHHQEKLDYYTGQVQALEDLVASRSPHHNDLYRVMLYKQREHKNGSAIAVYCIKKLLE
mgnify:CR=1 FL=1